MINLKAIDHKSAEDFSTYIVDATCKLVEAEHDQNFELAKEINDNIQKMLKLHAYKVHQLNSFSSKDESDSAFRYILDKLDENAEYVLDQIREQRGKY